ncbi:hypothetical protein GIB67_038153 [Kingdonia uniflora]|uniref:Uncharacterized protein n=1 Tax=Kingdonia uniflora TaxID=39325 RepID=A0A7J7M5P4_9MAGN|nr:hypothetical protein GIB67_038153 [Kingdonia uniflora]
MWEASREALNAFQFSDNEEDLILGKAFGQLHSRACLSHEVLCKVLKKFPEVLGCHLDEELKSNIQLQEKEWGIKGQSLRSLLLCNPKVLG